MNVTIYMCVKHKYGFECDSSNWDLESEMFYNGYVFVDKPK